MKEVGGEILEDLGSDKEVCQEVKLVGMGWAWAWAGAFNYSRCFTANQGGVPRRGWQLLTLSFTSLVPAQLIGMPVSWLFSKRQPLNLCLTTSVNFPQQMNPHQTFIGLNLIPECSTAHK